MSPIDDRAWPRGDGSVRNRFEVQPVEFSDHRVDVIDIEVAPPLCPPIDLDAGPQPTWSWSFDKYSDNSVHDSGNDNSHVEADHHSAVLDV